MDLSHRRGQAPGRSRGGCRPVARGLLRASPAVWKGVGIAPGRERRGGGRVRALGCCRPVEGGLLRAVPVLSGRGARAVNGGVRRRPRRGQEGEGYGGPRRGNGAPARREKGEARGRVARTSGRCHPRLMGATCGPSATLLSKTARAGTASRRVPGASRGPQPESWRCTPGADWAARGQGSAA